MKNRIIALVLSSTILIGCGGDANNIQITQTSDGITVGAFRPPTDRALIYYSEFELVIPESAKFESYGDFDDMKISWLTIKPGDRQRFIDLNNIKIGATDSVGRLTYTAPIINEQFPKEKWVISYIVGLENDVGTYMRIEIKLKSRTDRNTQSKEFITDSRRWIKSGAKIKLVE